MTGDYLHFAGHATMAQVVRAYLDRDGQWWWLLVAEIEGTYRVCSFGSLLPYLTGRTPHIVHHIGDCAICSGMDPVLWKQTGALVEETLADAEACARLVSTLPLAKLLTIESCELEGASVWSWVARQGSRVCGVLQDGALSGIYVAQMRGEPIGMPDF